MGFLREQGRRSAALRGLKADAVSIKRRLNLRKTRAELKRVQAANSVVKMHIGSGTNQLKGWLNVDLEPQPGAFFLDASQAFPFDDASFDYIYSEHMIEHISWQQGLGFLAECFRVLKPGGVLRIATPDLRKMVELYTESNDGARGEYNRWISETFNHNVPSADPVYVLNNAFRAWGHQFIYDKATLESAMAKVGFGELCWCDYGQSAHDALQNIEHHGSAIGELAAAEYETIMIEGQK